MAITRAGNAVKMESGDSLSGRQRIQAIYAEDSSTLEDSDGNEIINLSAGEDIQFPCGIEVTGVDVSGTGPVFVYLQ